MNANTKHPLVSIGIPTYNRSGSLRQTLKCVTGQSYRHLEIIVSDNCSPGDDTRKVVQEFLENDSRIQYYRQEENKGPTFNFNFVLKKASGEFFMWAADDDEWKERYIEDSLKKLNGNTVLCYSEAMIRGYNNQGQYVWQSDMTTKGLNKVEGIKKVLINQHRNTEFYGVMKTNIAKQYEFQNTFGEDHVFLLYMALNGEIDKTEPGLFVSGISSTNIESIVESHSLSKSKIYFAYIYQMVNMIQVVFKYKYHIGVIDRLKIIFWIFYRYFTRRYRRPIKRGLKLFLSNLFKGKL